MTETALKPPTSCPSRRLTLVLACLLLVLGILPRIEGVVRSPMQADEKHWVTRAETLLTRFNRNSRQPTSHLGHPGVFPTIVLATGRQLGRLWTPDPPPEGLVTSFSIQLTNARLGNAYFSGLLPCLVFLALLAYTGAAEAFCVGVLLALSPNLIDLGQLAHIDTIHAVAATATIFTYLAAIRRGQVRYKIAAGIFFGLCLLSKPTSIALIPAFLVAKVLLKRLWPEQFKEHVVAWSDIWTGLISLATFVLFYSRMWHHAGDYPQWVGLDRRTPELLHNAGAALSHEPILFLTVAILLSVIVRQTVTYVRKTPRAWIDNLLSVLATLVAWWTLFPKNFENLALYWTRVFALSSVQHESFQGIAPPIPGGYIALAIADLPPLVIITLAFLPLTLIPKVRRTLSESEKQVALMAFIVSIAWLCLLSASSKQAWRYAMSIVPQLYILACLVLSAFGRTMNCRRVFLSALVGTQIISTASAYPTWDLYHSPLAPPPAVALEIGLFHPRTGQVDALRYLADEAKKRGRPVKVVVFADSKMLILEARKWLGKDALGLHLGYYRESQADFILVPGLSKISNPSFEKYNLQQPVFVAAQKGIPVMRIYGISAATRESSGSSPEALGNLVTEDLSDLGE